MKNIIVALLFVLAFYGGSHGQTITERERQIKAYSALPNYTGYVNDFEGILTATQEKELTKIINKFEQQTGNQIAIITVDSIAPYSTIKDFATSLGNKWGVGQKDKDNGLIIVFSSRLRQTRIATGLGTEKILTDQICQKIIDEKMIPHFRNGEYFKGLQEGLTTLINNWK